MTKRWECKSFMGLHDNWFLWNNITCNYVTKKVENHYIVSFKDRWGLWTLWRRNAPGVPLWTLWELSAYNQRRTREFCGRSDHSYVHYINIWKSNHKNPRNMCFWEHDYMHKKKLIEARVSFIVRHICITFLEVFVKLV